MDMHGPLLGVINPPYSFFDPNQQSNRTGGAGNGSKYHLFCQKLIEQTDECVSLTPDGWMVNPKHKEYREFLIANGLKSIHLFSRKIFANAKLMGDVCVYHNVKGYDGDITIVHADKTETITREQVRLIGFIPEQGINLFEQIKQHAGVTVGNLYKKGRHWTTPLVGDRTKVYCDILSPIQTDIARYKMVSRLGGNESNNEILWIANPSEAINYHKVCVTSASAERKITYLQYVPAGVDVSEKIVYFPVNDREAANRLIEYLNSDYVSAIVYITKILSNNSKEMLSNIPLLERAPYYSFTPTKRMLPVELTYGLDDTKERKSRRKKTSEVFTPDQVADYMVDLFESKSGTVFDPTCGDGQLLVAAAAKQYSIRGNDLYQDNVNQAQRRVPAGTYTVGSFL